MAKGGKNLNQFIWLLFTAQFCMGSLKTHVQSNLKFIISEYKPYSTDQNEIEKIQLAPELSQALFYMIGSLIMIILIVGLLHNTFRLKKRFSSILHKKKQEMNKQRRLFEELTEEKEWLLKEIQHRVKNNLQIVVSLLNSQSAYLDHEEAFSAIKNSQNRIFAMSLIYQKLYESNSLSNIDMSWYVAELIKECFNTKTNINFTVNTRNVCLDITYAVPLGLIINEVLNNVVKHAFPFDTAGDVFISIKKEQENDYQLIISDNGIGLPENFKIEQLKSFGMTLIIGLCNQIDGTLEIKNENGVKAVITFTNNTELSSVLSQVPNNF